MAAPTFVSKFSGADGSVEWTVQSGGAEGYATPMESPLTILAMWTCWFSLCNRQRWAIIHLLFGNIGFFVAQLNGANGTVNWAEAMSGPPLAAATERR